MKIILINNYFRPQAIGGAEIAVECLADLLAESGHDVMVLTQPLPGGQLRVGWPRLYQLNETLSPVYRNLGGQAVSGSFAKVRSHFLDHFKGNRLGHALDDIRAFGPDLINIHNIQTIGYQILGEIARLDVSVCHTVHDFSATCVGLSHYRNGRVCPDQCRICGWSEAIKRRLWSKFRRLGVWAPSEAILRRVEHVFPETALKRSIPLALRFGDSDLAVPRAADIELLYVGRLHPSKGVRFLLEVLDDLPSELGFRLTVLGRGEESDALRHEYGRRPWLNFVGFVPPDDVSGYMQMADCMVVPSLWPENSPLVVYQALFNGLPVFASDVGGLPGMLRGKGGKMLAAADKIAWSDAVRSLVGGGGVLASLRDEIRSSRAATPLVNLALQVAFFEEIIDL